MFLDGTMADAGILNSNLNRLEDMDSETVLVISKLRREETSGSMRMATWPLARKALYLICDMITVTGSFHRVR